MNTTLIFPITTQLLPNEGSLSWIVEREHDVASWLEEIDLELHEQVVCGARLGDLARKGVEPAEADIEIR